MTRFYPYYNAFSDWLLLRYGCRVRKVALTSPFGCPNRDGTIGQEGCFFCDGNMFGFENHEFASLPVGVQLNTQIEQMEKKAKSPQKYLAYLQAGTNTYGTLRQLKSVYQQLNSHPKVISVAIGTRPDCIDEDKLYLIKETFEGKDIWIELGVQSSNEETLKAIGRNHGFSDTVKAINLIKEQGLFVCAHLIAGLPGESQEQMIESVRTMNMLEVDGLKFHPLSICKGARYAEKFPFLSFPILDEESYIDLVILLLEYVRPSVVIQRLVGGGRPEVHLAPDWVVKPARVIQKIRKKMEEKGLKQGSRWIPE